MPAWTKVTEELFWHCKNFLQIVFSPSVIQQVGDQHKQWNIGLLRRLFLGDAWCTCVQLLRAYPVALIFIQLSASLREHDSTIFYSLGKKGVGCHSVNIHGGQQRDTRAAQQCLHLGVASWGYRTAVSKWGQHAHWPMRLHLFTSCLPISFRHFEGYFFKHSFLGHPEDVVPKMP